MPDTTSIKKFSKIYHLTNFPSKVLIDMLAYYLSCFLKMFTKILHNFTSFILDLVFPIECLNCNKEGQWLCDKCKKEIKLNEEQNCPICKNTLSHGYICNNCESEKNKFYFERLLIATKYEKQHLIQKLIKTFKYRCIKDLDKYLSSLLSSTIKKEIKDFQQYTLLAIPLHPKKEKKRGFNQSELLTISIARSLNMRNEMKAIKRIKNTKAQAQLHREERLINLKNAFIVNGHEQILNKKIILIDDISSTLTTLNECAKVLKENDAKEIICCTIARG